MKVGFCGLGKLGLPCALAAEVFGRHTVCGYDIYVNVAKYINDKQIPYMEKRMDELLARTKIDIKHSIAEVVADSDIVFVPIQTPHDPLYEGITPLPDTRVDFNYSYLIAGVKDIAAAALAQEKHIALVVISTVLPGTMRKEIKPLLNEYTHLVYNPAFIAMGTTVDDFTDPEFVLVGCDDEDITYFDKVARFYHQIHGKHIFKTNIETAEMIKMGYNTFISMKIAFINTFMEIAEKTEADIDDFSKALSFATDRIVSAKYVRGGMGDGGSCHPRDNIALSYLARELGLSHDIFSDVMYAREDQTRYLINLMADYNFQNRVVILGYAYKPETNLTVGSPGVLLVNMMKDDHRFAANTIEIYDPFIDKTPPPLDKGPALFFIATNHAEFAFYDFPYGSVVIDPWGYIPDKVGVKVIRVGRKNLAK